jgi:hypothetical protein
MMTKKEVVQNPAILRQPLLLFLIIIVHCVVACCFGISIERNRTPQKEGTSPRNS